MSKFMRQNLYGLGIVVGVAALALPVAAVVASHESPSPKTEVETERDPCSIFLDPDTARDCRQGTCQHEPGQAAIYYTCVSASDAYRG